MKMEVPVVYPIIVPTSSSLLSFNFYLVKSHNSLFLIDAGINTENCWIHFMNVLQENGFKVSEIDKIILTHNHSDHTGLVNRILDINNVPVYAHEKAVVRLKRDGEFISKRIDFFQTLYSDMGCKESGEKQVEKLKKAAIDNVSQIVNGEILLLEEEDVIEGFKVIETPGHAPDHIALLNEESGILIAGDHLIQHISSNALIEPDENGVKIHTLQQYEQSLKKCLKFPLTVVYPGHGGLVSNPHALIERRLKGIERKSVEIKEILNNIPFTAAQIAQLYYKEKYESEFSLVMSEIIGHLDRLEQLKKISKVKKGNEWYYYSNISVANEEK